MQDIVLRRYGSSLQYKWDDFVEKSRNGIFLFKRKFMDYHSDRFVDNSFIFYEKDQIIAVLPANLDNQTLYSHQGLTYGGMIVCASMKQEKMIECFSLVIEYMKKNRIQKLIYKQIPYIFSNYPSQEDEYALFRFGAKLLKVEPSSVINLKNSLKMAKGRKAQISRATREGVSISLMDNFSDFIELENKVLMRHNTKAVHTSSELELLHSRFPQEIQLIAAIKENKPIAYALFFVYKNSVHVQYMASDEEGRKYGGLDLIIKFSIDKFTSENKEFFDFGISCENAGRILNTGLISEKEGFAARTVCLQTWELELT